MGATVIDGKALAAATKAEAAEKVKALKAQGINPCLAVILVGENPASQVYVRGKINDCAQCGIESRSINLPADTTQDALLAEVKKLADDSAVHGILVQLPLPAQIDEKAVIDAIPPEKDVDGFSPVQRGPYADRRAVLPALHPGGLHPHDRVHGHRHCGQERRRHWPLEHRGQARGAAAAGEECHGQRSAIPGRRTCKEVCAAADILVAAVGREGFVTGDMVKPGGRRH